MGVLGEGFTVLAIIEARDQASEIYEHCGAVMKQFGGDVAGTADVIKGATEEIDESLASTASGVDPLALAAAKVSAAEDQMTASTAALADAQRALLAASGNVAPQEAQAAAAEDVAVAQQRAAGASAELTGALAAQREALAATAAETGDSTAAAGLYLDAQGRLRDSSGQFVTAADAQEIAQRAVNEANAAGSPLADALAASVERVAAANREAAGTSAEAAAAQARQNALVTSDDVAGAAQNLTTAEKGAASASRDLSAAQSQQVTVQKAVAMSSDEAKAAALAESAAQKEAAENSKAFSGALSGVGKVAAVGALGLGVAGALMVKSAGNFQDSTAHLQTDAGVTAQNLGMIRANILNVSTATGQSASSITDAMYHIASSGFTGANSLGILKAAAEGARVGGADLDTTSKALVGTLTAYYGTSLSAGQATKDSTSLMNQLIQTVGSGDMRMQDLASSLSAVTPVAAAAHISFAQVGGALATMTAQGMTARQASQDLAHTIRSLSSPTNVQSTEMKALGLNANTVSKNLGTTGLAGTLSEMRNAVLKNTSGGYVMLGYLKQMSPAAQGLANQIMAGSISTGALTTAVKGLNPEQASLITKFKAAAVSATGLKQTYTGAMYKMTGGATGLNVAMMLTGKHMGDLTKNTAAIAAKAKDASGNVDNWSTIQGTFNFKVAQAKTGIENTGIAIGSALLPAVSAVLSAITKVIIPIAEWTAKHKTLTEILFVGVTALSAVIAVVILAGKTFKAVSNAVGEVQKAYKGAVSVLQKLGGQSKKTADQQSADAKKTAADQEQASGESASAQEANAKDAAAAQKTASEESAAAAKTAAGEEEAASAEAAGAAETDAAETAGANEEAAATSSGSWVTAAGTQIAAAARWVAQQAVQVAQVIAKNVAGAATTLASWVATGAGMIAQGAVWVAQTLVKVAVIVASNVAGAAVTAAAWIVANAAMLLGIGLIVAAVVVAVVLIIKYWKQISSAAVAVWHDIVSGAETAFHDVLAAVETVIKWVKSNWPLLLAILTGPIGLAVLEITKHWTAIKDGASEVIGDVTRFFTGMPGRILSALGDLGSLLFGSGKKIVQGLINGVTSMIGDVAHTAESVVSTIKSFLPFSPAKQGPLSGSGDPSNSGKSIASKLAQGMLAARGTVTSAAGQLAGAASLNGHIGATGSTTALSAVGAAGTGGAGVNITIDVHGNTVMSESDATKLANQVSAVVVRQLAQAGVKVRMG